MADPLPPANTPPSRLGEVAWYFLRLGATAFGGPAAHLAMMEEDIVRRRQWLSRGEFLDLVSATHLIPGPNSTELAIHLGHRRAGWAGLLVAGLCFIAPATLLVGGLAWAYVHLGAMLRVDSLLYGVKPVIIAIVVQALWRLGPAALRNRALIALGLLAVAAGFAGVHELAILFGCGWAVAAVRRALPPGGTPTTASLLPLAAAPGVALPAAAATPFSLSALFLFFAKVGAVLFGSGYVLLAFLRAQLVERWQWLTEQQLLDAIAIGQITPGPLFSTATFIGYLLGGVPGAVAATAGIFLPAFVFVAASGPLLPRLRRSALAAAFLDGLNVASLALMAVVAVRLATAAIVDVTTLGLGAYAAFFLLRFRVNSAWLVLGGAILGVLSRAVQAWAG